MFSSLKAILAIAMASTALAGNHALIANGNTQNDKTAILHITGWGSDFYFAICAVMAVCALSIIGISYTKPRSDRIFFYLCAALCFTAAVAYFSMGSNLGWTPIDVEWIRGGAGLHGRNREVFYVRYIDWFGHHANASPRLDAHRRPPLAHHHVWTIFLDEAMVVTGLVGALVKSSYKWGYFVFGCVFMFGVFYELAVVGRASAKRLGDDVYRCFLSCGLLTLGIWCLYPVALGLYEDGNVISPNDEAVFYGCLDFIAKPIFSIALIYGHWNIDPARLGLAIPQVDAERGNGHHEKHAERNVASNGHSTGVSTGNGVANGTSAVHHDA